MRSVPRGSFARLSSFESLWTAWHRHRRNKRRRPAVAAFDLDADRELLQLHDELRGGSYAPRPYLQKVIVDPKLRLVSAPALRDRVLHQAIVAELAPHYERRYIDDSFACRPGLGPQRAALRHLHWTRRCVFRMKLDIRAYFRSVDHELLIVRLSRRLRDVETINLLRRLVEDGGEVYRTPLARRVFGDEAMHEGTGLPVGSCLSQWCANLYLDGLDHHVKRELRVSAYLRYMDDLVLFANDRGTLVEARAAIREWLARERRLALNPKYGHVTPTTEPVTFLGYRVSRAGVSPSRKLRRRLRSRVRRAAARGDKALVRTLRSYAGLLME